MDGISLFLYVEAAQKRKAEEKDEFFVQVENYPYNKELLKLVGLTGTGIHGAAWTFPENYTYTFRKMGEEEFLKTIQKQMLTYPLTNDPFKGEKWLSESMQHSQGFKADVAEGYEHTAEFSVDKKEYSLIRDKAIPQKGSSTRQPKDRRQLNVYNKERLATEPNKINLGLKGNMNVDDFNKHVVKVTKFEHDSFMNKNNVLRWIRRHKIQAALMTIGIIYDGISLTMSIVEDGGKFGKSTQIKLGEMVGSVLGGKIGAAVGSLFPGIGQVICTFVGAFIGALLSGEAIKKAQDYHDYLFSIDPVDMMDEEPQ